MLRIDRARKRLSRRTKMAIAVVVLALPLGAIALALADHSRSAALIWLFSPGLPIALHFSVQGSGFLGNLAFTAIAALLIDFAYYAALVFALLSWINRQAPEWLERYLEIQPQGPSAHVIRAKMADMGTKQDACE